MPQIWAVYMLNSHQNLGALRLKRGPSKLPWLIIHQDVLVEEAPELLEAPGLVLVSAGIGFESFAELPCRLLQWCPYKQVDPQKSCGA